jgi:hypothetical protein
MARKVVKPVDPDVVEGGDPVLRWDREHLPEDWAEILNDRVIDVALEAANNAYRWSGDEHVAIAAGIAAANGHADERGISVLKG